MHSAAEQLTVLKMFVTVVKTDVIAEKMFGTAGKM
jgi:hypothetical protein